MGKIKVAKVRHNHNLEIEVGIYYCPNCQGYFEMMPGPKKYTYEPNCGSLINWEESK